MKRLVFSEKIDLDSKENPNRGHVQFRKLTIDLFLVLLQKITSCNNNPWKVTTNTGAWFESDLLVIHDIKGFIVRSTCSSWAFDYSLDGQVWKPFNGSGNVQLVCMVNACLKFFISKILFTFVIDPLFNSKCYRFSREQVCQEILSMQL